MVERQHVIQAPDRHQAGLFAISLDGEFDIAECTRVLDAFGQATSWPVIVVDFERTQYVDSTVLECLVALERAASKRGAKLMLVGIRPEIRRIFEICDLHRHFDIRANFSEVAAALRLEEADVHRMSLVAQPVPEVAGIEGHRTEVSW